MSPERYRNDPEADGPRDLGGIRSPFGAVGPDDVDERERTRRRRLFFGGAGLAGLGAIIFALSLFTGGGGGTDNAELLQRGVVLQNAGQLDEAAGIYREVIDADPDNKVAYFNLGVIDHTQGQTQEAAANYVQVLSIDPVYVPALFNLAILRTDEGDAQGAIGLYRRVIAADADNAPAMLNLGILLLENGEEAEATELISRAVEIDPSLQDVEATTPQGATDPDASTTTPPDTTPTTVAS
jgi:tetratricopeptide (TPR) repeat protein